MARELLLPDDYVEGHTYKIMYTRTIGRYRCSVIEEPPQVRLLHYQMDDLNDDDPNELLRLEMPLPWVYTYLKFARNDNGIWKLWDTRVSFAPTRVTNPMTDQVWAPYIPNVSADTSGVCWGGGFDYELPDDPDAAVRRVIAAFWARSFNEEIKPQGGYFEAMCKHVGIENPINQLGSDEIFMDFQRMFADVPLEEVLALTPQGDWGGPLTDLDGVILPGINTPEAIEALNADQSTDLNELFHEAADEYYEEEHEEYYDEDEDYDDDDGY